MIINIPNFIYECIERWNRTSPKFFKIIDRVSSLILACATSILAINLFYSIPLTINLVCTHLVIGSTAAMAVCKLTVRETPIEAGIKKDVNNS